MNADIFRRTACISAKNTTRKKKKAPTLKWYEVSLIL